MSASSLPASWGWENGPLESFQAFTLLLGMLMAWLAAYQQRDMPASKIWLVAALFWLGMLGRELAWGAVFLPPLGMSAESGQRYTSSVLWWKPAVVWVSAAMLLRWMREHHMPWGCLAVFVLAMVLGAVALGACHAGLARFQLFADHALLAGLIG